LLGGGTRSPLGQWSCGQAQAGAEQREGGQQRRLAMRVEVARKVSSR